MINVESDEELGMNNEYVICFPLTRIADYWTDKTQEGTRAFIRLRYSCTIQINVFKSCYDSSMDDDNSSTFFDALKELHFKVPTFNSNALNYYSCLKELLLQDIDQKNKSYLEVLESDHATHDNFLLKLNEGNSFELKREKNFSEKMIATICRTYPKEFLVPLYLSGINHKLKEIIAFREKQRIPVVCYIHKGNQQEFCSIWRSGQVKVGLMNNTSPADEELIKKIGQLTFNPENKQKKAYVFDCRPYINAYSNKIAGKGFISDKSYHVHEVIFGNIENIHFMRNAFDRLLNNIENEDKNKTVLGNWFDCLKSILKGAMQVRDIILRGDSVIVNCSDGWDRTPQVISLSKILLEPYYRTIEGFRVLLHYEWIGFGHKFNTRQQYKDNKEESPIFIQFLDCVHQMVFQYPKKFEFTTKLLVVLAKAYTENIFFEFHCDNTEQYLEYLHKQDKLVIDSIKQGGLLSIWQIIDSSKQRFINPDFINHIEGDSKTFDFDDDYFALRLWKEVYSTFKSDHHRKRTKKGSFIRAIEEEFMNTLG